MAKSVFKNRSFNESPTYATPVLEPSLSSSPGNSHLERHLSSSLQNPKRRRVSNMPKYSEMSDVSENTGDQEGINYNLLSFRQSELPHNLSAKINKDNVLDMTSDSEVTLKKKMGFVFPSRVSESNKFLSALSNSEQNSTFINELERYSTKHLKNRHSNKISAEKIEENEDSTLNNTMTINKDNIPNTSDSRVILKKKLGLTFPNRVSENNKFLSALSDSGENFISLNELERYSSKYLKSRHSNKISPENLEENIDSEDLTLNNTPVKTRVKLLGKRRSEKINELNIFHDKLTDESISVRIGETSHKSEAIIEATNLSKSRTGRLNLSSSPKSLHPVANKFSIMPDYDYDSEQEQNNDVAVTLSRQSSRRSANMISDAGIETHNTPRTRSSTRNSKNISADKNLNADKIDESTALDEAKAADDQNATPAARINPQKSSENEADNRNELARYSSKYLKSRHSSKISPENLEENIDSEDLTLNNTPMKTRVKFLGKRRSEKINDQNIFHDNLTDGSISGRTGETSRKSDARPISQATSFNKSRTGRLNLSSSPKLLHPMANKSSIMPDYDYDSEQEQNNDVAMTLPRRSIRHSSNMISDTGIETRNIPRTRSFVRNSKNISADKKLNADKIDESTVLDEAMAADDQDATPAAQTNSQKLSKDQTGNRTIRRTSARLSIAQVSNETHFRDISRRQSSLTRSQSQRNTPLRSLNINNKTNTNNRMIDDFFKTKQPSIGKNQAKSYDQSLVPSEIFKGAEKMRKIQDQVEAMKSHGRAAIKIYPDKTSEKRSNAKVAGIVSKKIVKKKKLSVEPAKKVDKAYLVNGKVYKAPRLPRPKQWVTDRFYKFMWKRMEPKYKLSARIRSEKFVEELNKVVTFISRCAKYDNYKAELEALMKEMARLRIINTPNDFYNFCRDFMPYEFRVKVIPILLPGNRKTIPYDPEKLHTPLLDE